MLRYGRLKFIGMDFNNAREKELNKLAPLLRHYKTPPPQHSIRAFVLNNPVLKNLAGQAAFVKQSFIPKGKHFYIPALKLCYVRNCRAASTSLSSVMMEHLEPRLKGQKLNETQINFLADVYTRNDLLPLAEGAQFFTVIRNPFARIVSAYRYFFESDEVFNFEDYLFGILSKDLTFEQFIKRLAIIPDRLKDNHFKPQTKLFEYYYRNKINVSVLKLEKPDEIKSFLASYNLTIPLLNQSPEPYDYRKYFTKETLNLAYAMYKDDIKQFQYEQEFNDLKEFISSEAMPYTSAK